MKRGYFYIFLIILLSLTVLGCTSERYEDVVERNKKVDEEISAKEELNTSELNDLVEEALEYGSDNSLTGADIEWISLASKYGTLPTKQGTTQEDIDDAVGEIKQARSKARDSHNATQDSKTDIGDTQRGDNPKSDENSSMTTSQSNAVLKAKNYLSHLSFSRDGLIEQLEYEKFSHEDAVFGADNCGADWMNQAVEKAKSYLEYSAFSYDGLIGQLEHDQFTNEQAVHGVDNCGADWNEQAAKKAEEYLKYSSFSRDSLIDQLVFEGFTQEQAEYGVSTTGL